MIIFERKKLKSENKCVGVPPPPPPPPAGTAVARHFALPKQTPWRRPWLEGTDIMILILLHYTIYNPLNPKVQLSTY